MINRRTLLTSGLALKASAITVPDRAAAGYVEYMKFVYCNWLRPTGGAVRRTNFAVYAQKTDSRFLKRGNQPIRVRTPYWRQANQSSGLVLAGSFDNGFNGNGYRFQQGQYGIYIPGPRKKKLPIRVWITVEYANGREVDYMVHGIAGTWHRPRARDRFTP